MNTIAPHDPLVDLHIAPLAIDPLVAERLHPTIELPRAAGDQILRQLLAWARAPVPSPISYRNSP
eukprot:298658-Pyramimonas_sp.AAC.1